MNHRNVHGGAIAADDARSQSAQPGQELHRKTGLGAIGDLPWGTHFCQFYATPQDLLETLVPYFRAGLAANEFCMWVISAPLQTEEAKAALRAVVPDLDERLDRGQIEILDHGQWYTQSGSFDAESVLRGWAEKLRNALQRGFVGLRLTGDTFWLEDVEWEDFKQYENTVHRMIGGSPVLALCSYSLDKCGLREILDVVGNHEFALVKRGGKWEVLRGVEHQAEVALRESRERLERFAEIAFEGIAVSENGKILDCNRQFAELTGYPEDELKGMAIEALIAPEDRERVAENIRLGRDSLAEHAMVRKDGSRIFVEVRGKNSAAHPARRYSAIQDITAHREVEEALRTSQADLNRAQAVGHIGNWRMDVRRNILLWSDENHRIFGIPPGTPLTYETFLSTIHPEDRNFVDGRWQAALRGEPYDVEHRLLVDGKVKWVRERAELEFDGQGRLLGGFGTTQDISDRKRAEEALREADRRKDEFLAMLAHELRNPLAPIRNAAHVLGRLSLEEPRVKWAQETIEGQVAHLTRLVDDLLDVSRIVRGKIALKKEKVEFAPVVQRVLETVRPLLESKGHRIVANLPGNPVRLEVDPVRLSQVLLNLLDNAAKYTPEGGRIELGAAVAGGMLEIRVRDNGIGIPPELLPHVFELFQQGERTLDRAQGGLGLGLTLAQRLAEMHGGKVDAYSAGSGKGATFTVRLPILLDSAAGGDRTTRPGRVACPGLRVLVVDDEPAVADSTAVLLEMENHQVRIAPNGHAALEQIPVFRPQAVVLDIGLGGMDGFETARRLRRLPEGRNLLLTAVTGYGDEETRLAALEAGCDHHLVKPVNIDVLLGLLADAAKALAAQSSQP